MPNPKLTEIAIILDRSGSMGSIKSAMVDGFEKFMSDQRQIPDPCTVSLYQFDNIVETVYEEKPISDVMTLDLHPRDWTALYDAMGYAINAIGRRLAAKPEDKRPGKVIVLVVTDGLENCSKEFTQPRIAELVTQQREKYNWQFAFLGANIDSFAVGKAVGVAPAATSNFEASKSGVNHMYNLVGASVMSYRSSGKANAELCFSPKEEDEELPSQTP